MRNKIVIFGYGITGKAAEKYFNGKGKETIVFDDNKKLNPFTEDFDYSSIDFVLKSPGVNPKNHMLNFLKDKGIKIFSEIDIFAKENKISKIIGITGTNGKSSVTNAVCEILKNDGKNVVAGGNLGYPILGLKFAEYYVLELSSYQLHDSANCCDFFIACITNLDLDHLDYHGSIENYWNAKKKIFQKATHRVIGGGCAHLADIERDYKDLIVCGCTNEDLVLQICELAGVDRDKASLYLSRVKPLEHRLELVLEKDGFKIINDSKATNLHSTIYAIDRFEANIILILGGLTKGEDFSVLSCYSHKIKMIYLIGDAADKLASEIKGIHVEKTCDLASTIQKINLISGDILLFSPACASFDQFDNFEHRGKEFKRLIHEQYC